MEKLNEKNSKKTNGLSPPENPIYEPYIKAIENSYYYAVNKKGSTCGFDAKGYSSEIANFVARPVLEITKDDGNEVEKTLRIEGILSGGEVLPQIDIPISDFQSMNWVLSKWGVRPIIRAGSNKKDLLRDAIQSMGLNIKKKRIYTHLGFRKIDNKWVYLHSGGCIGEENVDVDIEKALSKYALPKEIKDIKKAARASLALINIAPKSVTISLLALVYLTPLLECFRIVGIEPNFILWLMGISGSRKTTLALLYLSHFGNFNTKTPPASFKDTANNIERKAFTTKDSLLLIDDYHPESNRMDASKMEQTAQKVLRMYGDRIGRGRLTSTIQFQKTYEPRGNAIVTGEDIPKGQSSIARFWGAEVLNGDVNLEKLTECQNDSELLAEAMVGYIQWLIPQMEELPKQLLESFKALRDKYQKVAMHGRFGEMASWLYIGYGMMLKYMKSIEVINDEDIVKMLDEFDEIILELINKQNSLLKQEKPAEIFTRVLSELFATSRVCVEDINRNYNQLNFEGMVGAKIGYRDENYYYLYPETVYNEVSKFLSSRGEILPVKEKTLWKHLDEGKLIHVEIESDGRVHRCIKKNIPNKGRPRLLHLRRDAIDNMEEYSN